MLYKKKVYVVLHFLYLGPILQILSGANFASKIIKRGVPQGSVLGPLLFLIYINDLYAAILYSDVHHFADDTNLINISGSLKQLAKRMNLDLRFLSQWLNANKSL